MNLERLAELDTALTNTDFALEKVNSEIAGVEQKIRDNIQAARALNRTNDDLRDAITSANNKTREPLLKQRAELIQALKIERIKQAKADAEAKEAAADKEAEEARAKADAERAEVAKANAEKAAAEAEARANEPKPPSDVDVLRGEIAELKALLQAKG